MHRRVRELECSISLVEAMKAELRFTLAEPSALLHELIKREWAGSLPFLKRCDDFCRRGDPFPLAWAKSIDAEKNMTMTPADMENLEILGETLGSTGLEGQIDQLALIRDRLQSQLEDAKEQYQTSGRLYRSLGVLGGIALVILLW